jgi:hypothetical protein
MTTPTPLLRQVLTSTIRGLLATGTGLPVGDGRPPDPLPDPDDAYLVLSEMPGVFRDADAHDLFGGASLPYQLTAVGKLRDQCAAAADWARGIFTQAALQAALDALTAPAHLSVASCASDGPGATEPRGAMFNTPETYTVAVFRMA